MAAKMGLREHDDALLKDLLNLMVRLMHARPGAASADETGELITQFVPVRASVAAEGRLRGFHPDLPRLGQAQARGHLAERQPRGGAPQRSAAMMARCLCFLCAHFMFDMGRPHFSDSAPQVVAPLFEAVPCLKPERQAAWADWVRASAHSSPVAGGASGRQRQDMALLASPTSKISNDALPASPPNPRSARTAGSSSRTACRRAPASAP